MNCVLQDLKQNFLRGYSVIDLRIEKNSGKQLFPKLYELMTLLLRPQFQATSLSNMVVWSYKGWFSLILFLSYWYLFYPWVLCFALRSKKFIDSCINSHPYHYLTYLVALATVKSDSSREAVWVWLHQYSFVHYLNITACLKDSGLNGISAVQIIYMTFIYLYRRPKLSLLTT